MTEALRRVATSRVRSPEQVRALPQAALPAQRRAVLISWPPAAPTAVVEAQTSAVSAAPLQVVAAVARTSAVARQAAAVAQPSAVAAEAVQVAAPRLVAARRALAAAEVLPQAAGAQRVAVAVALRPEAVAALQAAGVEAVRLPVAAEALLPAVVVGRPDEAARLPVVRARPVALPLAAASAPASSVPEGPSHRRPARLAPAQRRCGRFPRGQILASEQGSKWPSWPTAAGEFWSWISGPRATFDNHLQAVLFPHGTACIPISGSFGGRNKATHRLYLFSTREPFSSRSSRARGRLQHRCGKRSTAR